MVLDKNEYEQEYQSRFLKYYDELKWLYCELYENHMDGFYKLCDIMYQQYRARKQPLKKLDRQRAQNTNWYKGNQLLGMMLYVDAFAGNLKGVREKLD